MSRHIADQGHAKRTAERLKQYTRIERSGHPDQATQKLQRRAEDRDPTAKVKAFTKIDRES